MLYITERCVFRLVPEGLELIEIALGVDLQRDILNRMDFVPVMRQPPCLMDARIFEPAALGLRTRLLELPMEQRLTYDAAKNLLFVNFEGLHVRSLDDLDRILRGVEQVLAPVEHKVEAVVNYDRFQIAPELVDDYAGMVKGLMERHYTDVTRYGASSFVRAQLGDGFDQRHAESHWVLDQTGGLAK